MRSRFLYALGSLLLVIISLFSIAFNLTKKAVIKAEEKTATDISEQVPMNSGVGGI